MHGFFRFRSVICRSDFTSSFIRLSQLKIIFCTKNRKALTELAGGDNIDFCSRVSFCCTEGVMGIAESWRVINDEKHCWDINEDKHQCLVRLLSSLYRCSCQNNNSFEFFLSLFMYISMYLLMYLLRYILICSVMFMYLLVYLLIYLLRYTLIREIRQKNRQTHRNIRRLYHWHLPSETW